MRNRTARTALEPVGPRRGRRPVGHSREGWQSTPPVLESGGVTLRALEPADAPSLLAMIASQEVSRYISPPPSTLQGFERFVAWSVWERLVGSSMTFGVLPDGLRRAIGVIQVRALGPTFEVAEWGVALGSPFWGSGLFVEASRLAIDFAFFEIGVHRLEARSVVENDRGNGAMRKVGAVQEGLLRRSLLRDGRYFNQYLWTILDDDWKRDRRPSGPTIN